MSGLLSNTILNKFISTLINIIGDQPQLRSMRDSIEKILQTDAFRYFARDTLIASYEQYQDRLPSLLDNQFMQQESVQEALVKFILFSSDASQTQLLVNYHEYLESDGFEFRTALANYLWSIRVEFNNHPQYGPILRPHDTYIIMMITRLFAARNHVAPNLGCLLVAYVDSLLLESTNLDEHTADQLKNSLTQLACNMADSPPSAAIHIRKILKYMNRDLLRHARDTNLLEGENQVRFAHALLRDYFASRKLAVMVKSGDPATTLWSPENWWEPTGFENAMILMAGRFNENFSQVINWVKDAQPELTANCILKSGVKILPQAALHDLQDRWMPRLTDLENDPEPHARAAVGRALGYLNLDNRPGVGLNEQGLPDFDWVLVEGGPYTMGNDEQADFPLDGRIVHLDAFYISRYPVTYAQYTVFVEDDGYANKDCWTDAGWDWIDNSGTQPERYWRDEHWHIANHPVAGLTWFEAYAFTRWVSVRLGYAISLPDQYQWEAAARGKEGRTFTYRGEYDANKCNAIDTGLGRTSPVGIFPNGATPEGIHDLSGNVWEWCQSQFKKRRGSSPEGDSNRVIRGGAFYNDSRLTRAASRLPGTPFRTDNKPGFRVVCSATPPLVNG